MKQYVNFLVVIAFILLVVFNSCKKDIAREAKTETSEAFASKIPNDPGFAENDMVMYWNDKANTVLSVGFSQPARTRVFARIQIAVHDVLNSIKPKYERYAFHEREQHADPNAAVASAAYWVMKRTTFVGNPPIDQWYSESLATIPDGESKELGKDLGKRSA
ncbi:MAG TPA: hypothetical protein VGE06_05615, partial [Flavisolibacter sp.]